MKIGTIYTHELGSPRDVIHTKRYFLDMVGTQGMMGYNAALEKVAKQFEDYQRKWYVVTEETVDHLTGTIVHTIVAQVNREDTPPVEINVEAKPKAKPKRVARKTPVMPAIHFFEPQPEGEI